MKVDFLNLRDVNSLHGDAIRNAINEVVDSGWYIRGRHVERFERRFADYIGTRYCVGVGNGLDALSLMLCAYKKIGILKDGDEVIVPANTFIASVLAITESGLIPVFAEPRFRTLELDESLIEGLITPRTRAVMLVHLYGRCAYSLSLAEICNRHGLLLLEDNAQAHGCCFEFALHNGKTLLRRTGSLGNAAAHSFYPGKNLGALGDGGCVTTDDECLAQTIRALGNYGSSEKYVSRLKGKNSRLDEIQAAVLDAKLDFLDEDNAHRQMIADIYYNYISNDNVCLPDKLPHINNVYHIFPVLSDKRDLLREYLENKGVQTLIHYPIPPHRQECYREYACNDLPVTDRIHNMELSLPIGPTMNIGEAEYVVDCINNFI